MSCMTCGRWSYGMKIPPRNASTNMVSICATWAVWPSKTRPMTSPSTQNGITPSNSTAASMATLLAARWTWPYPNPSRISSTNPGMISSRPCASLAANQRDAEIGDTRSWRIQPFCRSLASCGPVANMAEPMPDHTAMETIRIAGQLQQLRRVRHGCAETQRPGGGERLDLGRGAAGDDPAVVHHDDPGRVGVRLFQVVRGEQHGGALPGGRLDRTPEVPPCRHVESRGGLVEEQQFRVARQRQREPHPLGLAARQ